MDNLECPICLETARDAVECQECAQILCNECTITLTKCPMCRKESSFRASAFARRLINNLPTNCPNCNMKTTNIELNSHIDICPERKVNCSLCDANQSVKEIASHAANLHSLELTNIFFDSVYEIENSKKISENSNILNDLIKKENQLVWENKSKVLINRTKQIITRTGIKAYISLDVKFKFNCKNTSYVVVGLSSKPLCIAKGYLGGDLGLGNWGLAGNGSLGEEGKWITGKKYNNNDIINIKFENGHISYTINGINSNYSKKFSSNTAYIACTLYNENDKIEIID